MYNMGVPFYHGIDEVLDQDIEAARHCLLKAANFGDSEAQDFFDGWVWSTLKVKGKKRWCVPYFLTGFKG